MQKVKRDKAAFERPEETETTKCNKTKSSKVTQRAGRELQGGKFKVIQSVFLANLLISLANPLALTAASSSQDFTIQTTTSPPSSIQPQDNNSIIKIKDEPAVESNSAGQPSDTYPATTATTTTTTTTSTSRVSPQSSSSSRLRPSIEEVASELSKKHLNLEHENWRRLKHNQPSTRQRQLQLQNSTGDNSNSLNNSNTFVGGDDTSGILVSHYTSSSVSSPSSAGLSVVALEEEIFSSPAPTSSRELTVQPPVSGNINKSSVANQPWTTFSLSSATAKLDGFKPVDHLNVKEHYLHTDSISSTSSSSSSPSSLKVSDPSLQLNRSTTARGRRKKQRFPAAFSMQHQQLLESQEGDDNELYQCHQYLRHHNSLASSSSSSSRQLPCSCEIRTSVQLDGWDTFAQLESQYQQDSSWLSCDYVQLIGSHFYTLSNPMTETNSTNSAKAQRLSQTSGGVIRRFSQRDSGLQTLHSQKFHYLLLSELKFVDLSRNRIRQIKTDVFHGLETKLEYLNLAFNLLGHSNLVFDDYYLSKRQQQPTKQQQQQQQQQTGNKDNGKVVFHSDQLNILKNLKWLSLQQNQISAIGPNVFVKQPSSSSNINQYIDNSNSEFSNSELRFLDLSENLMNIIPSDSIQHLNKLQVLSLRGNRITQLDQTSKFPKTLKYLDLSENLIKLIKHSDLIDLTDLIELNLSQNQLSRLDKTAFISSSSISTLLTTSLINGNSQVLPNQNAPSPSEQSKVDQIDQRMPSNFRKRRDTDGESDNEGDQLETDQDLEARESALIESGNGAGQEEEEDFIAAGSQERMMFLDQLGEGRAAGSSRLESSRTINNNNNNFQPILAQFNSTRKLNLSHNYFEQVPGDTLLKFTNLRQLDMSHNRIRRLDSNYLCSIYNLVENLREINLSGNLMSLQASGVGSSGGSFEYSRHLNKLFGCLQRLEKLELSTNRFGVLKPQTTVDAIAQFNEDHEFASSSSSSSSSSISSDNTNNRTTLPLEQPDRLVIKFGESFGNKFMNSLDLSDNQLKRMPLIEQFSSQPINLMSSKENKKKTNKNNSQDQLDFQELNSWLQSRSHLETLRLSYNSIDRLEEHDFEHLFNLRSMSFDYNKLTNIPSKLMKRFTNLEELSLEGNQIFSLEPLNELFERSITTLETLNLANNRISEWPSLSRFFQDSSSFSSNNNNKQADDQLGASSNGVGAPSDNRLQYHHQQAQQVLPFALKELRLEGNLLTSANISSLFDQLIYMRSLKTLNLSFNFLNRIRSEWFKFSNKNLRHLSLSGNKINLIDLGSFAPNQVDELLILNLSNNLMKELKRKTFDSMANIQELNLANNLIHTINSETFNQINTLKILRLNNNRLTSWKCEYFSHLCNSISGNINADLSSLISSSIYDTYQLSKEQQSTSGSSQQSSSSSSSSSPVSSLTFLDLSHNSLSQLRANSISVHTKLTTLDLSYNKLSFIPHDLFKATTASSSTNRQIQLASSLKYLNLAHNRIQTIDNINFRPLKNLLSMDLSFNELQTLGVDVIAPSQDSTGNSNKNYHQYNRRLIVTHENLTESLIMLEHQQQQLQEELTMQAMDMSNGNKSDSALKRQQQIIKDRMLQQSSAGSRTNWPALSKLRYLNLANNQLTLVNQSLLSELSPFALLNLDLSFNYLDSEALPHGFYTKISGNQPLPVPSSSMSQDQADKSKSKQNTNYDMVFTLKLESLDLSHNRLHEFPALLLENHYSSIESCNLSHNRIQNLIPNSNLMIQIKTLNLAMNPLSRESNELLLFEQKNVRHLNLASTRLFAIQQMISLQESGITSSSSVRNRLANQTSELDLIRSIGKPIEAPYVRHLNLSSNQLVWLAANVFNKMHSLQTLDLSNNQLTRLHLLNNQLAHTFNTLEYLNLNTNLFTNIDASDFSQLGKLRHLDLSNLLSLQKLNCKFLSRLNNLRSLRMFNYPQLRLNLNNLISQVSNKQQLSLGEYSNGNPMSERIQRKLRLELLMSSVGKHCFVEHESQLLDGSSTLAELMYSPETEESSASSLMMLQETKWIDLSEIELELLNDFSQSQSEISVGFKLTDQLSHLLGSRTKTLSLYGLNMTDISEESLLGITGQHLNLRISYTSISQAPLNQVLTSIPKRTRLELDFRNNNIQSIDTNSLQLLDELQVNNQILQHGHHSSIKLGANPIKCDCQTRPLWLWLNQGRGGQPLPVVNDQIQTTTTQSSLLNAQADDGSNHLESLAQSSPTGNNFWFNRFSNAAQSSSDIKCFYPARLRGKLTQHVYYNELVCSGNSYHQPATLGQASTGGITNSTSSSTNHAGTRLSRGKKNETSSNHLYSIISDASDSDASQGDILDEDYLIDLEVLPSSQSNKVNSVRLTKFNKFPSTLTNNTNFYLLANAPAVPFIPDGKTEPHSIDVNDFNSNIGRRDQQQPPNIFSNPILSNNYLPSINIQYQKHRPNTQQRHSHFNTFDAFADQIPLIGKSSVRMAPTSNNGNYSLLTDSDVMILTVISIAMTSMTFVIISVCLFKYKLDRSDNKSGGLLNSNKLFMAHAIHMSNPPTSKITLSHHQHRKFQRGSAEQTSKSSSDASSSKSPKKSNKSNSLSSSSSQNNNKQSLSDKLLRIPHHRSYVEPTKPHIFIPVGEPHLLNCLPPIHQNGTQNFLMRSPTIRRMQTLAMNSADWFKFAVNKPQQQPHHIYQHPAGDPQKRRLFLSNKTPADASQLTTGNFLKSSLRRFKRHRLTPHSARVSGHIQTNLLATGCPLHSFKILESLSSYGAKAKNQDNPSREILHPEDQCSYCKRLLRCIQQTKVHYVLKSTDESNTNSSSSSSSSTGSELNFSSEQSQKKTRSLPDKGAEKESAKVRLDQMTGSDGKLAGENQDDGHYIPPSLIQAIAKQLNEKREKMEHQRVQQESLTDYRRYQQQNLRSKPMKTFGLINNSNRSSYLDSQRRYQEELLRGSNGILFPTNLKMNMNPHETDGMSEIESNRQSQLPTEDVNGRFTYQTESQLESPAFGGGRDDITTDNESTRRSASNIQSAAYNVAKPTSTATTSLDGHQDDNSIFILIQEHLKQASQSHRNQKASEHVEDTRPEVVDDTKSAQSVIMLDDECSHSSSPVAYGFMRSSPSNTTLSTPFPNGDVACLNGSELTNPRGQRTFAVPISGDTLDSSGAFLISKTNNHDSGVTVAIDQEDILMLQRKNQLVEKISGAEHKQQLEQDDGQVVISRL